MRRFLATLAAAVALSGLTASAAMASAPAPVPAATAHQPDPAAPHVTLGAASSGSVYVQNNHTGHYQGASGGNPNWVADGDNTTHIFKFQGVVCGSGCSWPFTPGSGLNATFNGNYVYVIEYAGNPAYCWQITATAMSSYQVNYQTGDCGSSHWYSYWVAAGASGGGIGLVNVGQSNAQGRGWWDQVTFNSNIDHLYPSTGDSTESYNLVGAVRQ